jgi:hypothetical protein
MATKHHGTTLTSLFDELGEREDFELLRAKKRIAMKLELEMKKKAITRTALSKTMKTSRTLVNRLLDPSDTSTTLSTLVKAQQALGVRLFA